MTSSVIVLAVSLLVAGCANAAKVPSNWKTCKRSLPAAEYEKCIYEAVTGAVNDLMSKGQPSLGIPPINPLKITTLDIGQGSGPVAIDLHFENVEFSNLDSAEITKIRHKDAENYEFGADVVAKKPLILTAKYTLSGKVLVLPINGHGNCRLQMDNMRGSIDLKGQGFKKGEETYMNVTGFESKFEMDRMHLNFENLFDGNKELGDSMNVFLNENWAEIVKELKPAILQAFSEAFRSITNQIFVKVPFNKLVPK